MTVDRCQGECEGDDHEVKRIPTCKDKRLPGDARTRGFGLYMAHIDDSNAPGKFCNFAILRLWTGLLILIAELLMVHASLQHMKVSMKLLRATMFPWSAPALLLRW